MLDDIELAENLHQRVEQQLKQLNRIRERLQQFSKGQPEPDWARPGPSEGRWQKFLSAMESGGITQDLMDQIEAILEKGAPEPSRLLTMDQTAWGDLDALRAFSGKVADVIGTFEWMVESGLEESPAAPEAGMEEGAGRRAVTIAAPFSALGERPRAGITVVDQVGLEQRTVAALAAVGARVIDMQNSSFGDLLAGLGALNLGKPDVVVVDTEVGDLTAIDFKQATQARILGIPAGAGPIGPTEFWLLLKVAEDQGATVMTVLAIRYTDLSIEFQLYV